MDEQRADDRCGRRRHVLRSTHLLFRTPTLPEWRAAIAGASDPAAQRWLGWLAASLVPEAERAGLLAIGADAEARGRLPIDGTHLVAVDPAAGRVAGAVSVHAGAHGPEVGGWLAPGYRGRGWGAELFGAGAEFGHRHLGHAKLRAGAEVTHRASLAALRGAGFTSAWGLRKHALPDRRVVETEWFEHVVERGRRCR